MTRASNKSSAFDSAVGFYAISRNVHGDPSPDLDHEETRTYSTPARPPTPAEQQLCMYQTEAESCEPHVVSVNPGRDTEAVMTAVEAMAISSPSLCDYEPNKVGVFGPPDLTSPRIGGLDHSPGGRLQYTGSHAQGGSSMEPAPPPETIAQETGDSNDGPDSATETVENDHWFMNMVQKTMTAALNAANNPIIDELTRTNKSKARKIQHLKGKIQHQEDQIQNLEGKIQHLEDKTQHLEANIRIHRDHSNRMDIRCKEAEALLREANTSAAELQNDIARLSNAQPELTRDDQYFMNKFSGVFFSLEGWVLQYFMHSKIDSSNLQSLPAGADLIEGLNLILGEGWEAFASEETLHCIEAAATLIIQKLIFDIRMLGILGDSFPAIEQHFGCSEEIINAWRVQTTRMIVCDKDFPSKVERRVCEVVKHIERVLGPLVDGGPKRELARIRRLKAIIEQAADLAVECSKEPSTFTFVNYNPGWDCNSSHMTDAHRAVDDEHLADRACVKFTVSPTVLRAPKQANDEPIIILKARVVRHLKGSPASEKGSETHGQDAISEVTGAQLN